MKPGDTITISHRTRGACPAVVDAICTPEDLPPIPGAPPPTAVKEIMHEWRIDRVAMVTYNNGCQELGMMMIHTPTGWQDLRGQNLEITPRAATEQD